MRSSGPVAAIFKTASDKTVRIMSEITKQFANIYIIRKQKTSYELVYRAAIFIITLSLFLKLILFPRIPSWIED